MYQLDISSRYFESPDISAEYHLDIRHGILSPEYQAGFERSESGAESTDSKLHYTQGHAEDHAHAHVCGEDVALRGAARAWHGLVAALWAEREAKLQRALEKKARLYARRAVMGWRAVVQVATQQQRANP